MISPSFGGFIDIMSVARLLRVIQCKRLALTLRQQLRDCTHEQARTVMPHRLREGTQLII